MCSANVQGAGEGSSSRSGKRTEGLWRNAAGATSTRGCGGAGRPESQDQSARIKAIRPAPLVDKPLFYKASHERTLIYAIRFARRLGGQ
jgi:hypothetical protein